MALDRAGSCGKFCRVFPFGVHILEAHLNSASRTINIETEPYFALIF